MRRSSSLIRAVLLPTLVLILGVSWCPAGRRAGAEKEFFRPDAPDMPAYTLPDVLTAVDGRKIATAETGQRSAAPRSWNSSASMSTAGSPPLPYQKSFRVVREDPDAMDGAATLKQIDITITAAGKSLTIHLALFVPNSGRSPSRPFC